MANKEMRIFEKYADGTKVCIGLRPRNGENKKQFYERIAKEADEFAKRQTKPLQIPNKK
jgi:hypothetical protein